MEIIDTLVDKLASYKGVVLSSVPNSADAAKDGSGEGTADSSEMEISQPPPASSVPQADAKPASEAAKEKQVACLSRASLAVFYLELI